MNLNRFSKFTAVLLALTLALSAVAPAAAVTVDARDSPNQAEVGSEISATYTVGELYTDYEQWTLNGQTELQSVTWTVTTYDQAGNRIEQQSFDGQSFNQSISVDNDVDEVDVKVRGTVPEVENYTYDPAQVFLLAELNQVREGGNSETLQSFEATHYTSASASAREAIDSAGSAIEDASDSGADVSEAEGILGNAVSAYEGGNFGNAEDLASKAETNANEAEQSAQSTAQRNQLLLYGGIGVVGLGLIGGIAFWYRSQQDSYDKLR